MFDVENVMGSHPVANNRPAIFRIPVKGTAFDFRVHSHPSGNSLLQIWTSEGKIFEENIDQGRWQRFAVSIPRGINELEIRHIATDWNYEQLYFDFGISEVLAPVGSHSILTNTKMVTFSNIKMDSIYSDLSKEFYCRGIDPNLCLEFQLIDDEKPTFKTLFNVANIMGSHPVDADRPAIFHIPVNGDIFYFRAHSHPGGNSQLQIWVSEELIFDKIIDEGRWQRFLVSIPEGVRELEFRHIANDWSYEQLYFDFGILQ